MADYLCRIRLDRATEGEEYGKLTEEVESKRIYLRLTDGEKREGYVSLSEFMSYVYIGNDPDAIKVQALLSSMTANEILGTNIVGETIEGGTLCPLCNKIFLTNKEEDVTENLEYVYDHIKICKECGRVYCDGGEEIINETATGEIIYPETHTKHKELFDHYPVETEGIKLPKLTSYHNLVGRSLLNKFKIYCLTLDEKLEELEYTGLKELDSYLKEQLNLTDTTYLNYKYVIADENGGYTLRLKIEINPCDSFLTRTEEDKDGNKVDAYKNLEQLEDIVNRYLSYNDRTIATAVIPDMTGLSQEEILDLEVLKNSRISVNFTYSYDDNIPKNIFLSSNPEAGETASMNTSIDVVLSKGPAIVPDMTGMFEEEITKLEIFKEANIKLDIKHNRHDDLEDGIFISSNPEAGALINVGSTIEIIVSSGFSYIITDMVEWNKSAIEYIFGSKLKIAYQYEYHDIIAKESCIRTIPSVGGELWSGQTLTVILSKGPVIVPELSGMTEEEINNAIKDLPFSAVFTYDFHETIKRGLYVSSEPEIGDQILINSVLNVIMSKGVKTVLQDLTDKTKEEIEAIFSTSPVNVTYTEDYHDDIEANKFVSYNNENQVGDILEEGDTVSITISKGPVIVPDLTDKTISQVKNLLSDLPIIVDTEGKEYHDTIQTGRYVSSSVAIGEQIKIGETLYVIFSRGRVRVPYFTNKSTREQVETAFENIPLVLVIKEEYNSTVSAGYFISCDPAPNKYVDMNTEVIVKISKGAIIIPNMTDMLKEDIEALFESLPVTLDFTYSYHDEIAEGLFVSSSPRPGDIINQGETLTITLSLGQIYMPDVTGKTELEIRELFKDLPVTLNFTYDFHDTIETDKFVSSSLEVNQLISVNSTIEIQMSSGPVIVPNLVGLTREEIINELKDLPITVVLTEEYTNDIEVDKYSSSSVAIGEQILIGDTLEVIISKGQIIVPEMTGMDINEVIDIVSQELKGARIAISYNQVIHDILPEGMFISSEPVAGEQVELYDFLKIFISAGFEEGNIGFVDSEYDESGEALFIESLVYNGETEELQISDIDVEGNN